MYPVTYSIFLGIVDFGGFFPGASWLITFFLKNTLCNLRALWLSVVDHFQL